MTSGARHLLGARWRTVAVFFIGALGITLRLIMFFRVQMSEQVNAQNEFSQRATAGATALRRSLQEHLEVLNGLSAVYAAAAQPLTRKAFQTWTQGPLKRYPGVQALGWVPRIAAAEYEGHLVLCHDRIFC